MSLNQTANEIRRCTKCPLWKHRLQALPGEGNSGARFMVIIESPDENADRKGSLWDGEAGQKLKKILLDYEIDLDDVFFTSLVKCCSHGARIDKIEIHDCNEFLEEQIRLLKGLEKVFVIGDRSLLKESKKIVELKKVEDMKKEL